MMMHEIDRLRELSERALESHTVNLSNMHMFVGAML